MKRLLFLPFMLLALSTAALCQTIQPYEGELRLGLGGGGFGFGTSYSLELRHNYDGKPYDLGLQLKYCVPTIPFFGNHTETSLSIVGDLNARQGKKFNPFIGTAVGVGYCTDRSYSGEDFLLMTFTARAGFEFFKGLRLMADIGTTSKGNAVLNFYIGIVVGGGNRKNK